MTLIFLDFCSNDFFWNMAMVCIWSIQACTRNLAKMHQIKRIKLNPISFERVSKRRTAGIIFCRLVVRKLLPKFPMKVFAFLITKVNLSFFCIAGFEHKELCFDLLNSPKRRFSENNKRIDSKAISFKKCFKAMCMYGWNICCLVVS